MGRAVSVGVPRKTERFLLGPQSLDGQCRSDEHGVVEHQSVEHSLSDDSDRLRHQRRQRAAVGVHGVSAPGNHPHHPSKLPRRVAARKSGVEAARGRRAFRFLVRPVRRSLVARGHDLRVSWMVSHRDRALDRQRIGTACMAWIAPDIR